MLGDHPTIMTHNLPLGLTAGIIFFFGGGGGGGGKKKKKTGVGPVIIKA